MADITERLRELSKARWDKDAWERETTVRIPAEPDRDIDLVLANAAAELDRLRARVAELEAMIRTATEDACDATEHISSLNRRIAELEAAKGEPVAWMNPYGGTLQVRITGLEYEKYTIPLYTAPPAPTVDVDAISDEAIERAERAVWSECGRCVNAKLIRTVAGAIFNKGE